MKAKTKTKKKTNGKSITRKFKTTRTIRGVKRKVEVSIGKDKKESIKMINPMGVGRKKEKRIPLPKEKAKEKHSTRSKKSRKLDESKTNKKKITDTRWKKNPGRYDYPGVDTLRKNTSTSKTQKTKPEKKAPKVNKPKRKSRIDKLKKMGNLWEKYGKRRIYFDSDKLMKKMGLEVDRYNTGNISSATLKGEHISNSRAKERIDTINNANIHYDIDKKAFGYKSNFSVNDHIAKDIIKELEKTT